MLEVKKGKKVARLHAETAREPQEAPSKNESWGWGPLKESKKQQPASNLDNTPYVPEARWRIQNILNYFGNISKYFGHNFVIFARWPETLNS